VVFAGFVDSDEELFVGQISSDISEVLFNFHCSLMLFAFGVFSSLSTSCVLSVVFAALKPRKFLLWFLTLQISSSYDVSHWTAR